MCALEMNETDRATNMPPGQPTAIALNVLSTHSVDSPNISGVSSYAHRDQSLSRSIFGGGGDDLQYYHRSKRFRN